jgi:hypothetical protein
MRRTSVPGLIVLLAISCSTAGGTGPQANPSGRPAATPRHTDFKVVLWYRRDRPLETFKYQVYDVRKGQDTPAVDAWLQLLRTKYPAYDVMIREVDLARVPGETESLKVGSVIKRELLAAAALEGIVIGDPVPGFQVRTIAPRTGLEAPTRIRQPAPQGATLDRSSYLNPPGPRFPFPMPYPRPHP